MASSMSLTTTALRKDNINFWIAEYYNPHTKTRADMFNIFDIIALDAGIIGIQACKTDIASHRKKIMVEYETYTKKWLQCGGLIEVWAWRKLKQKKKDGKMGKRSIWIPRIFDVGLLCQELFWEERRAGISTGRFYKFNRFSADKT